MLKMLTQLIPFQLNFCLINQKCPLIVTWVHSPQLTLRQAIHSSLLSAVTVKFWLNFLPMLPFPLPLSVVLKEIQAQFLHLSCLSPGEIFLPWDLRFAFQNHPNPFPFQSYRPPTTVFLWWLAPIKDLKRELALSRILLQIPVHFGGQQA